MSEYKRQHFIPCSYLKFFSVTGTWSNTRNTQIFFTDGATSNKTKVSNLGVESYTYSKENPEFDKQFHDMERHYPAIIQKLLDGKLALSSSDYFGLFMIMVDFNLRNVAYENKTEGERRHAYEAISRSFNSDVFQEANGNGSSMQGMMDWLTENWRVQRIIPETNEKFLTSDNPSTIFSNPKNGKPVMLYLPAHPKLGIIAYDRRYLKVVTEKTTDDALSVLNGLQVNRCVRHTFSDHDITNEQNNWKNLRELSSKEKPTRWIDNNEWKADYISISSPVFERFTFIKKLNPFPVLSSAIKKALYE